MTASTGRPPAPSGALEIRLLRFAERECRPALSLILSGAPVWSEAVARQVQSLELLARRQSLCLDLLLAAYSEQRLRAAAWAIESPGRTAMVYVPPSALSHAEGEALKEVLGELQRRLGQRDVRILQTLLPPEDGDRPPILASVGFRYLAELISMDRAQHLAPPAFDCPLDLSMVTYREEYHGLFLRALKASYVDTLDCPGLSDLRTEEDAFAGHRATGIFDPRGWFVARDAQEPAGVMLTARDPRRPALEVVYMGVSPWARGQGVGDRMMAQAVMFARAERLVDVTLVVDSTNAMARRLYERWTFVETSRRRAWIATSRPHATERRTASQEQ